MYEIVQNSFITVTPQNLNFNNHQHHVQNWPIFRENYVKIDLKCAKFCKICTKSGPISTTNISLVGGKLNGPIN